MSIYYNTKMAAIKINKSDRTLESWRIRGIGPIFYRIGGLIREGPN